MSVVIEDRIYGEEGIESSILLELIESESVQRLKGISQLGVPDELYYRKGYSRYEHSIGVLILLKRLGADEKEQIAGLLHDVSHTAFSHVVDWVVGNPLREDFQDQSHLKFLSRSEIPTILEKYGYDYHEIGTLEKFRLLDLPVPSLCADRIDYSLRQMPLNFARDYFADLVVSNGEIVFRNIDVARKYALEFLDLQENHWFGYESTLRYKLLSNILREALKLEIIKEEELYKSEDFIINSLKGAKNEYIEKGLELMARKTLPRNLSDQTETVYKKFRFVDPKVITQDGDLSISVLDRYFSTQIHRSQERNRQGLQIPKI